MAQDPESRPISVSELLARSRAEDGDTSTDSGQFAATGRRRTGRDGSMSVAELTGEIPKITGPEPTATPTPSVAPRSSSPLVARSESAFPRSSSPAPHSGTGLTASGMPGIVSRSTPPTPADAATEVTPPVTDPPQTRDFNSTAITGIIPVVDDAATEPDDDLDFEAYRNFADYDTADDKPADKPKKAKKGLFGRKRKAERGRAAASKDAAAAPLIDEAPALHAEPSPYAPPSEQIPAIRPSAVGLGAGAGAVDESTPAIVPSVRRSAPPVDADADTGPAITPHVVARAPEPQAPQPVFAVDDTQEIGVVPAAPAVTPAITPSVARTEPAVAPTSHLDEFTDADVEPLTAPRTPASPESGHHFGASLRKAVGDDTEAGEIPDEAPLGSKHSPVVQWLLLIGQVVLGLAVGAGLFWGFTALWQWQVIFALVLAAVVIFSIVTLVHVVRRRHDLVSTLLALGVGLIVTIGPLVFLASSGR